MLSKRAHDGQRSQLILPVAPRPESFLAWAFASIVLLGLPATVTRTTAISNERYQLEATYSANRSTRFTTHITSSIILNPSAKRAYARINDANQGVLAVFSG